VSTTVVAADTGAVLVACAVGVGIAVAVGLALTWGLRVVSRRIRFELDLGRSWRSPVVLLAAAIALTWVLGRATTEHDWTDPVVHVLTIWILGLVAWIALLIVRAIAATWMTRIREQDPDSRLSRHQLTKLTLLERVISAIVITIAVGVALWTIPAVRDIGAGILASAGIVGIIAGLAAQTTLSNFFAGLQIAFTDAIRIDDIVEIEGQRGSIEEITLNYVVVRVWDGTSLILPCTYFTTTPFRNTTHQQRAESGTVELGVTWDVPIEELRAELARILAGSPHWDGDSGSIGIDDAATSTLRLVAVVSAATGADLAALRREVREGLVEYLRRDHPESVPVATRPAV
jgi:small-conductance mechanosensitive channel